MLSPPILAALIAIALVAVPAVRAQDVVVDAAADRYTLIFDASEGESLRDVLQLFSKLLAAPIDFLADEAVPARIRVTAPLVFEGDRMRDAFDSLLERHRFWSWDDVSGGQPQIVVRRRPEAMRGPASLAFAPRVITVDELLAGPSPRLPLYTVAFPLQHVEARSQLALFMNVLDTQVETVRALDNNVLLVTASRNHLLHVCAVLAASDVPPAGGPPVDRLAALEQRLAALEARLAAVEAKPGG